MNPQPDTTASIQAITQTTKDLSVDGPPADIKKYLEDILLPELDKQEIIYKQQQVRIFWL